MWTKKRLVQELGVRLIIWKTRRPPNFVVGDEGDPYLKRWYVLPRNPLFNIYLHHFLRSDDDRALHDHRYQNLSVLIYGSYVEHLEGGARQTLKAGDFRVRWSGKIAHRIELKETPCWTLFVTGPCYRDWGFICVDRLGYTRWVPWQEFTKPGKPGETGKGCG